MQDRVLVAARGPAAVIAERIEALARWYGVRSDVRTVAGGAVTLAALGTPLASAHYGERPPGTLDVLRSSDLSRYSGGGAVLAATADRAALVGGGGAPAAVFGSGGGSPLAGGWGSTEAWSTHAVAAAYVADGHVEVDLDAVPQLLALGFVGGGASLVAGVTALPVSTRVDLDASRAAATSWWPAAERWRALGDPNEALLTTLRDRLPGSTAVNVAGDADVAAAAARDLGIGTRTWPLSGAVPDPAAARWTDGVIDLPAWPPGDDPLLIDGRTPADALTGLDRLAERLAGVPPEVEQHLRERVAAWRDATLAAVPSVRGPRRYAVLGFEQHLAHGLRQRVPPERAALVVVLATPAVQRVLPWRAPARAPDTLAAAGALAAPTREWIADEVFAAPAAAQALGERWCRRTRSRFLAGSPHATTLALRLAGAVALDDALRDLP